jgi:hypothetical protein
VQIVRHGVLNKVTQATVRQWLAMMRRTVQRNQCEGVIVISRPRQGRGDRGIERMHHGGHGVAQNAPIRLDQVSRQLQNARSRCGGRSGSMDTFMDHYPFTLIVVFWHQRCRGLGRVAGKRNQSLQWLFFRSHVMTLLLFVGQNLLMVMHSPNAHERNERRSLLVFRGCCCCCGMDRSMGVGIRIRIRNEQSLQLWLFWSTITQWHG